MKAKTLLKWWPIAVGMIISIGAGAMLIPVGICLFGNGGWDGFLMCKMLALVVVPVLLLVGGAIAGAVATTGRRGALCGLLAGLPPAIFILILYIIHGLWWDIRVHFAGYFAGILAVSALGGFLGGRLRGYLRRRRQGLPAE